MASVAMFSRDLMPRIIAESSSAWPMKQKSITISGTLLGFLFRAPLRWWLDLPRPFTQCSHQDLYTACEHACFSMSTLLGLRGAVITFTFVSSYSSASMTSSLSSSTSPCPSFSSSLSSCFSLPPAPSSSSSESLELELLRSPSSLALMSQLSAGLMLLPPFALFVLSMRHPLQDSMVANAASENPFQLAPTATS